MPPPVTAASVEESLDLVMADLIAQLGEIHNNIQAEDLRVQAGLAQLHSQPQEASLQAISPTLPPATDNAPVTPPTSPPTPQ